MSDFNLRFQDLKEGEFYKAIGNSRVDNLRYKIKNKWLYCASMDTENWGSCSILEENDRFKLIIQKREITQYRHTFVTNDLEYRSSPWTSCSWGKYKMKYLDGGSLSVKTETRTITED